MKYQIYKAYTNTFDRELNSWDDVMEFIHRKANKLNFGFFRHWESDDATYFDCGPTTYIVKKVS